LVYSNCSDSSINHGSGWDYPRKSTEKKKSKDKNGKCLQLGDEMIKRGEKENQQ